MPRSCLAKPLEVCSCYQLLELNLIIRLDMSARDAQIFHSTFQSLDSLIKSFHASLPSLDSYGSESRPRSLMLVHAVTNAAIIKLHNVFAYTNVDSSEECMSAARSIVNNAQQDLGFVNPLMGVSLFPPAHPPAPSNFYSNIVLTVIVGHSMPSLYQRDF